MHAREVPAFYEAERNDRQAAARHLNKTDRRFSHTRLALFVVALAQLWASVWMGWLSAWWLVVPAALFVWLVGAHDRVIRRHETAERAVRWFTRGIERLEDRWTSSGNPGERFLADEHPYAVDLDICGDGSVFQLLSTPQTTTGEETLAAWLLAPAAPDVVRTRQAAVAELSEKPTLREDLFTLGVDARRALDSEYLLGWAAAPPALPVGVLRWVAPALALALVGTSVTWLVWSTSGLVPLTLLALNLGVGMIFARRSRAILHGGSDPARELVVLAAVFSRLRDERYDAPRLRELHEVLTSHGADPVRATRRLDRLIQMHDWQHNMVFAPFAAALLWSLQCAVGVEAWRASHGAAVPTWLSVVGEFEALAALATYRFEHPELPFPELVEAPDVPVFEAAALAHPLLPRSAAVTNDVRLGLSPQLIVVSGSNMSGKTTLLRAVGVNAVLGLAGAPVRARTLRLSPVAVGGTLRVQDSLLAGRSKFYAEVLRVKQLVEISRGSTPLLFLMDELFHGTNSRDRVEGAHGVLGHLVNAGAIGMVTTHDLALAEIGERMGNRAVNVHFTDEVVDGALAFDYRLRPGRATHGNALALMRAVGLDVGT